MQFTIPHMVWLAVGRITIDKYLLSMVIDLEPKNRGVGRPGSADSPGNPGFLIVFHPGSPDSFARLSR